MSSREFVEWMAYYQVEPFGELRSDFRAGLIASTIANLVRGKGDKPATPADFMPLAPELAELAKTPPEKSPADQAAECIAAMRATLPSA